MWEFLEAYVSEDSREAWEDLKSGMPWDSVEHEQDLFSKLGFKRIATEALAPDIVEQLLVDSPKGTIWGEFYIEPIISLANDFYPVITNCLQLSPLDRVPSLTAFTGLYRSDKAFLEEKRFSPISFMSAVCPRCHLIFVEGDVEEEFEPDDEDSWVDDDCPACEGSGEWVYDPIR